MLREDILRNMKETMSMEGLAMLLGIIVGLPMLFMLTGVNLLIVYCLGLAVVLSWMSFIVVAAVSTWKQAQWQASL